MKNKNIVIGLLPILLTACGIDEANQPENAVEVIIDDYGLISMPLSITTVNGDVYRLQLPDVLFTGPSEQIEASFIDNSSLDISLEQGEWYMMIDSWNLEKLVDGSFEAVSADLLSENPHFFQIYPSEVTTVYLQFQVGTEEIEFQSGDLEISFGVVEAEEPETVECTLEVEDSYQASPGQNIQIDWDVAGYVTDDIYISMYSGAAETYYLSTVVENTGSFEWTLPEDLNPELEYHLYVSSVGIGLDASHGEGAVNCVAFIDLEVIDSEPEYCELEFHQDYVGAPGDNISVSWDMDGFVSDEVYVAVFSEWGETYYLSTIVENTGTFEWTLPEDLNPDLDYHIYVEDADFGERATNCWAYSELDVVEDEADYCDLEFHQDYAAASGASIIISWDMDGFVSEEVYIAMFNDGGETYHLYTVVENTGSFKWRLPEDLDSEQEYFFYVEDASEGQRQMNCWDYTPLKIED